mmetsp:Transcript_29282/g.59069  ORF Transcript_29282/g.59069 Transcript_29282/m.59069 type:complete len:215 (-) Transcript_29282:182-826(-)
MRTAVTFERLTSQNMLSGFRSACTIRLRCMCLTLSMRMPKTSATSEKVRSLSCSQARSVSLSMGAPVRQPSPSGGGPINSISINNTTRVACCNPTTGASPTANSVGVHEFAIAPAPTSASAGAVLETALSKASRPLPVSSVGSHTNPQLSPKHEGVGGHSLGLSGLRQLSLGLWGLMPLASLKRNDWGQAAESPEISKWRPLSDDARGRRVDWT